MELIIDITKSDYKKLGNHLMSMDKMNTQETLRQDARRFLSSRAHKLIGKLPEARYMLDRRPLVLKAIVSLGQATNRQLATYLDLAINEVSPRTYELKQLGMIVLLEERAFDPISQQFVKNYKAV